MHFIFTNLYLTNRFLSNIIIFINILHPLNKPKNYVIMVLEDSKFSLKTLSSYVNVHGLSNKILLYCNFYYLKKTILSYPLTKDSYLVLI